MKSLTFNVTHGDWSANLQLPAIESLTTLAETIIKAVGFDFDHCYGFYDNPKRHWESTEEYTLFADIGEDAKPDDPGVESTRVDEAFKPGKTMLFLFDYGDDWFFQVTCTGEEESKPFKKPKILSTSGQAPIQYPAYEGD